MEATVLKHIKRWPTFEFYVRLLHVERPEFKNQKILNKMFYQMLLKTVVLK